MINTMSSFSASISAPSTFNVVHPLHCGQAAFRQQGFDTFKMTQTAYSSPTMTYNKDRVHPVTSPDKKARKSRVVFEFTTEEMAKYFHVSQREAAKQLGVATVTIKRNCRRLGIVWPYRLMKSKKNAINLTAISREDAERIRKERALERAKAGRSPFSRKRSPQASSSSTADDEAAMVMTMLGNIDNSVKLTEAGRAFARLPLDCMDCSN